MRLTLTLGDLPKLTYYLYYLTKSKIPCFTVLIFVPLLSLPITLLNPLSVGPEPGPTLTTFTLLHQP